MSEAVRRRTDLFAKAIGGLGTSALTAIGIAKFADVYPLPPVGDIPLGLWLALLGTVGGFAAMGAALVWFSRVLWRVNEAIHMPLEAPSEGSDGAGALSPQEAARVTAVYASAAKLHGADSLLAYAERAGALETQADAREDAAANAEGDAEERAAAIRTAALEAALLRERARTIRADVDEAQSRALLNVVRMRAHRAVCNWGPVLCFFPGLVAFGLGADYLDSQHTANAAAAADCAKAVRALSYPGANVRLIPAICGNPRAGS